MYYILEHFFKCNQIQNLQSQSQHQYLVLFVLIIIYQIKNLRQIQMTSKPTTKLYIEWLSQPSRALVTFCLIENIPHELVEVRIKKLEHRTPEYKKMFPAAKLPGMSDTLESGEQFNLFESHAIMRYLADRYNKSNLYPRGNIQLKAKVDSYLDWHHTNTRKCAPYLFDQYFAPVLGIKPQFDINTLFNEVESVFKFIERVWLDQGKNKYIGNNQQLTIADLSCYSEIIQMKFDDYDFKNKTPILYEWMQRIEALPEIQKTHQVLFKFAPQIAQNKQQAKL
ncbi:hypothetical protein ABPG72_008032 [Tetrahymena utriculariae]